MTLAVDYIFSLLTILLEQQLVPKLNEEQASAADRSLVVGIRVNAIECRILDEY